MNNENTLIIVPKNTFSKEFSNFSKEFLELSERVRADTERVGQGDNPFDNLRNITALKDKYIKLFKDSFNKEEISIVKKKVHEAHGMLVKAENFSKSFNDSVKIVWEANIEEITTTKKSIELKESTNYYEQILNEADYNEEIALQMFAEYQKNYSSIIVDKKYAGMDTVKSRLVVLDFKRGLQAFLDNEYNNRYVFKLEQERKVEAEELAILREEKAKEEDEEALKNAVIPEGDIDVTPVEDVVIIEEAQSVEPDEFFYGKSIQEGENPIDDKTTNMFDDSSDLPTKRVENELRKDLTVIMNKYQNEPKTNNTTLILNQIFTFIRMEG